MPEYISKDVAFQRLLCKESEFNHWNDYNLAQYIIAQIVPEDVVPATHIQKLGNKDCQHLMFSDCYGECTKCHLGIVRPDDSCEFGERRATTHV